MAWSLHAHMCVFHLLEALLCQVNETPFCLRDRFAEMFVDSGGVQLLLSLPSNKHTFVGLSFAFFGLASVPLAVERVVR